MQLFHHVLIALKEGGDLGPLLELARKAAAPEAALHLVTLVRIGTNEDGLARLRESEQTLEALVSPLERDGYRVTIEVGVTSLGAGADLVNIATSRDCDLIVLGLAKRTRVGKALMGSDAQRVLMSADVPVIVTRNY